MPLLSCRTALLFTALALPGCAAPGTDPSGGIGGANDSCFNTPCDGVSSSKSVVAAGTGLPSCVQAAHPSIALSLDGVTPSPTEQVPVDVVFDGVVRASQPNTVIIDACAPGDTGCTQHVATLDVSAPGLSAVPVPAGAFVHLRYYAAVSAPATGAIAQHVVVQNVPMRGGVENVVATSERVWLTADEVDGGTFAPPEGIDPMPITELLSACGPGHKKLEVDVPDYPPFFGDIGGVTTFDTPGVFEGACNLVNLDDRDEADGKHRGYYLVGL